MTIVTRRGALLTIASGALAAGCGGGGSTGDAPPCAEDAGGDTALPYCLVERRVIRVRGARDLMEGHAVLTNVDDNTAVIVARDALGFHALSAVCTHACCLVTLCRDVDCTSVTSNPGGCGTSDVAGAGATASGILCPCHGSSFRLEDGGPLDGPAKKPLPSYAMSFDGSDALVDTSRAADPAARV